jgi:hypothetical protein
MSNRVGELPGSKENFAVAVPLPVKAVLNTGGPSRLALAESVITPVKLNGALNVRFDVLNSAELNVGPEKTNGPLRKVAG